eukprot:4735193-Prymnesium_polylepis.1
MPARRCALRDFRPPALSHSRPGGSGVPVRAPSVHGHAWRSALCVHPACAMCTSSSPYACIQAADAVASHGTRRLFTARC